MAYQIGLAWSYAKLGRKMTCDIIILSSAHVQQVICEAEIFVEQLIN